MRRLVVLFSAATLSLVGGVIATSAVASGSTAPTEPSSAATEAPAATESSASTASAAQTTEAAASSTAPHPLIGAWLVENVYAIYIMSFDSDGTVQEIDNTYRVSGIGVWEATGPRSGAVTLLVPLPDDQGDDQGDGVANWRYTFEVSPDGQSAAIDWEAKEFRDGVPTVDFGTSTDTATRINVEPVGTPWDTATSAPTTSN